MSAYTPLELLRRWQQEELTAEQAMGHVLQIIQAFQQQLQAQQQRLRALEARLPSDSPQPATGTTPDAGETSKQATAGARRKKR